MMYGDFGYDSFLTPLSSSEIVRLNVGGHLYTTTKSTLDRHHSMPLMSILQNCDKEGNVFVDRNGRMFEYILEFLRTDKLCLPDDFSDFDSLTTEVIFLIFPTYLRVLNKRNRRSCLLNISKFWKKTNIDLPIQF